MKTSDLGTKGCNGSLTRGKERERTDATEGRNLNCDLSGLLDNGHRWKPSSASSLYTSWLVQTLFTENLLRHTWLCTQIHPLGTNVTSAFSLGFCLYELITFSSVYVLFRWCIRGLSLLIGIFLLCPHVDFLIYICIASPSPASNILVSLLIVFFDISTIPILLSCWA